jgi:hypothetical protein
VTNEEFYQAMKAKGQVIDEGRPVGLALIADERKKNNKKPPRKLVEPAFKVGYDSVEFLVPLALEPATNGPALKKWLMGVAAKHRRIVTRAIVGHLRETLFLIEAAQAGKPLVCKICRLGRSMDDDNIQYPAKWVRDSVALMCGVDDNLKGVIRWEYAQEPRAVYGVRIRLSLGSP